MPKKVTTQEFIERSRAVHGDKYGYAFSVYKGSHVKLNIHCNKHGIFEQSPNNHLSGNGCPACGNVNCSEKLSSDTESFITRSIKVHDNKYEYTLSIYESNHKKVKIICPVHGVFEQAPSSHLNGRGCNACANENRKSDVHTFIKKAKEIHGDKRYSYEFVDYRGSKKSVAIVCPDHGVFMQTPNQHIKGKGCHGCIKTGFDRTKSGFLYVLRSECGLYMKIGITHDPKQRHSQLSKATPFSFNCIEMVEGNGNYIFDLEKELLSCFQPVNFTLGFDGHTEWRSWDSSVISKLRKEGK